MRLLIFLIALVVFSACNGVKSNNQPKGKQTADTTKPEKTEKQKPGGMVGGPCSYRYDTLPAKLIRINPSGSQYIALFEVRHCDSCRTDSVIHYIGDNQYNTAEQKNKIEAGKIYQLIVQSILTGACTPQIERFNLEEYKR